MNKRFEIIERDGFFEGTRIIVDTTTGVQYLMAHWTNIGGLTVLLDSDGKPLLDPRYAK
ncbi:MAG: xylan 1,4-beta-xylosidase [Oscillospiraceae bacterium]|nr:xylan 1,4-beta-xylosidase [Oscillospiraceae bacterium]